MCWSLRVYWTVLHNLFVRFFSSLSQTCSHSASTSCCCYCIRNHENLTDDGDYDLPENGMEQPPMTRVLQHDYVIVDDIDANYLQLEKKKIETEPYYRTIDRATAEEILTDREDGTCLVRPYKETDVTIKYIVSIYAEQQFFHLFIRELKSGKELFYAIGQEKPKEKLFNTPNDIIEFYKNNILQCTNKVCTLSLVLRPIIV